MKKRLITLVVMTMLLLCLTSCKKSDKESGNFISGVECIILSSPDGTYYMIEKPQVNDEIDWGGLNPSVRKKWISVEHGEVAGNILEDMLDDNEFLDAKVSMWIKQENSTPYVDDIWDDDTISPEDVKALGLFEKDKCTDISQIIKQWK